MMPSTRSPEAIPIIIYVRRKDVSGEEHGLTSLKAAKVAKQQAEGVFKSKMQIVG